jgi:hypothetical protein
MAAMRSPQEVFNHHAQALGAEDLESDEIVAGWVPVVEVPRKPAARGPGAAAAASGLPHERAGFVILGFPSQGCAPSTPSSRKEAECASHSWSWRSACS